VILAFPCNQFGGQEPGSDAEVQSFAKRMGAEFEVLSKVEVNGSGADPLWQHLKAEAPGLLGTTAIKWNFTKFLVGRDGKVIQRVSTQTRPRDMEKDILAALK